jgi:Flp pilus assembly pilin Flp
VIEYALLCAILALGAVTALRSAGQGVDSLFTTTTGRLDAVASTAQAGGDATPPGTQVPGTGSPGTGGGGGGTNPDDQQAPDMTIASVDAISPGIFVSGLPPQNITISISDGGEPPRVSRRFQPLSKVEP